MEGNLPWIYGKTSVTNLPMTGAMRELVTREIDGRRSRRPAALIVIWVLAIALGLLFLAAQQFVLTIGALLMIALAVYATWSILIDAPRKAARTLAEGTYSRHIGWLLAPLAPSSPGRPSTTYHLQITDRTIPLEFGDAAPSFKHNAPRDEALWVVLDYVEDLGMVLVIWHARRGFIHTHALYDPEADAEWPKPETEAPEGPPPGREA